MKKILTIILDGFGFRKNEEDKYVPCINMETFNKIWDSYPHALLKASGDAIGLLKNQPSSSKIAHMTIGAGRILKQKKYIVDDFFKKPNLEDKMVAKLLKQRSKDVHIIGLLSEDIKEGSIDHILKMYEFLVNNEFLNIHFHLITDDSKNNSNYINTIRKAIKATGVGDIVSICGRDYALDYSNNWNNVEKYYNLVVNGNGISALNILNTVDALSKDISKGNLMPPIIASNNTIKDGDVVVWLPYKSSTSKEFLESLLSDEFAEFPTNKDLELEVFTFFSVDKGIKTNAILGKVQIKNALGVYLGELSLSQARIGDSFKKLEVTAYFDGGYDDKIVNCDKLISTIADPHKISGPEINAIDVTKKVVQAMSNDYDFILVNYSNLDIIANINHSLLDDASKVLDYCLQKVIEKAEDNFYKVIICGSYDNPNINKDVRLGDTEIVPFVLMDDKVLMNEDASIIDIAPTILDYMDIAIPKEMEESVSLIKKS